MTMLSFRVDDREAVQAQQWADRLGVDRSEFMRQALHRHLVRLASEDDAVRWQEQPLDDGERSLGAIADWGPAEDWSDWARAAPPEDCGGVGGYAELLATGAGFDPAEFNAAAETRRLPGD